VARLFDSLKMYRNMTISSMRVEAHLPERAAVIEREQRLRGLCCLHCGARYSLQLQHHGCAVCRAQGRYVSLRADYSPAVLPWTASLPYTKFSHGGEGNTPLFESVQLAQSIPLTQLWIKDESRNPTGSHKDRMSAIGITQALDMGAHTVVLASSGNAAISAAFYAQQAGLHCEVASYSGLAATYANELARYGARVFAFEDNAGRWGFVKERSSKPGYLALTNHHIPALGSAPLAIEGYKNIAYETYAQVSGTEHALPDHVMVPTARGDLAWGIYAGFADLLKAKKINRLPRIWIVEPFARLSRVLAGESLHADFAGNTAQFSTAGQTATYLQWQAATASEGGAVVIADAQALEARQLLEAQGISAELCAAAGLAAAQRLRREEKIAAHESAMLILTANASRDPSYQARPN
jgi:threonine synthase